MDSKGKVLFDQVVQTDYGILDLVWDEQGGWDGDEERFFAGQVNGYVGAADAHGVFITLARRWGGSAVRIVVHDDEPEADLEAWEDVVEVSSVVPEGAAPRWAAFADMGGGDLDLPAGSYRIRVNCHGRDQASSGMFDDDSEPVDRYLIEMWPAPVASDEILKETSREAAYWNGNRAPGRG